MSEMDEFFGQILASEQKAQESKSLLQDVKAKIASCTEKMREVSADYKAAHREYNHKVLALNDQEVSLKHLKAKQDSCKQQTEKYEQLQMELKKKLDELSSFLENRQLEFCDKVKSFSNSYDLVTTVEEHRMKMAREELNRLHQQELALTKDMMSFNQHHATITQLTNEKASLMNEIEWKLKSLAETETALQKEESILEDLQKEKLRVASVPQTCPEFIQLHAELEEYRNEDMEGVCAMLEKELQDLKRQQWQIQSQKHLQQVLYHRQDDMPHAQNTNDPKLITQKSTPKERPNPSVQKKWKFQKPS